MAKKSQTSEEAKETIEETKQETSEQKKPVKQEEVVYWSVNRSPMIAWNTDKYIQELQGGLIRTTQEQKWVKFENHYYRTRDENIIKELDAIIEKAKSENRLAPCMRYDKNNPVDRYVTIKLGDENITVLESKVNDAVQKYLESKQTESKIQII